VVAVTVTTSWLSLGGKHEPRQLEVLQVWTDQVPVSSQAPEDIPIVAMATTAPAPLAPTAADGRPLAEALAERASWRVSQNYQYQQRQQPYVGLLSQQETGAVDAEQIICAYSWDCNTALYFARQESGSDYQADCNNSGHCGTWQIDCALHGWRFTTSCWTAGIEENTAVAYQLWLEQGWKPWL